MARKNRENEFAVIGLGRFGVNLARRLEEMGHPVLGIERDPQLAKEVEDKITEVFVLDATNPEALAEADITAFKTVVVAISDDFETNALITSTLRSMGIPNIICLAGSSRHQEILLRIGANRVVIPAKDSGVHLADELSTPGLLNGLSLSPDYSLIEIHPPKGMLGRKVSECEKHEVYAIYTKPQSEESVSLLLRNAGLEVLCPRIRIKKYNRDQYEYVIESLFKSYIFACFDTDTHHHMIRYTRGVKYIVAKDHPIIVPQEIINAIQEQMEGDIITPKPENLFKGDRVVIREGPFASFYGIFQHPVPGRDRVVILLEALNSRHEVEDVSVRKA